MTPLVTVARFQLRDAVRSRWIVAYNLFFLLSTEGLLRYGGGDASALLSIGSIVLLVVPLVALVFGTVFLYQSREYTELLLAQPVRRGQLYGGLFAGLSIALAGAFVLGVGTPFALRGGVEPALFGSLATVLAGGSLLTLVFAAFAFVVATVVDDRLRGLGTAIGVWLFFALLYDSLVLIFVAVLSGFPIETPLLVLTLANPVDLVRVALLLQSDTSALLGYTGAVFLRFFGGSLGLGIAAVALTLWLALPIMLGFRAFARKDF